MQIYVVLGHLAQSVASPIVDPGVMSLILAPSPTFMEIDCDIFFYSHFPFADLRRVGVSYKRKYMHKVLVNFLVKFAQEKSVVR